MEVAASGILVGFGGKQLQGVYARGFCFVSKGLVALPDTSMMVSAALLMPLLFLKLAMFYLIFAGLRLRARTAGLSSLLLSNYSEFGLIVMVVGVDLGFIGKEWLVILALAISLSFVVTSISYHWAHSLYARFKDLLHGFEREQPLAEDRFVRPTNAEVLVVGTGHIGIGAYRALHREMGDRVWGMDANHELIASQKEEGMNVFVGDAESADLWESLEVSRIKLVLIATPQTEDCRNVAEQLQLAGYRGKIAAIARFEDDRELLLGYGIDKVFNFFIEAGIGFAEDSLKLIQQEQ